MSAQQSTALAPIETVEPLAVYIRRPDVVEKFSMVLGDYGAKRYIQNVLILVQNADPGDYSLQSCTKESIVRSALRAVTLQVSVDPAERQAWLVPNKNKKTGKIEANLRLHYQEIYNRMMRTNRYSVINVTPIYEGSDVFEDVYSGLHTIQIESGLMTIGHDEIPRLLRKVSDTNGKKRVGWLGYYRLRTGQQKTVYMTTEDIYTLLRSIPTWSEGPAWKNEHSRGVMEMKTVLLALLRKADMKAQGMEEVKKALDVIDQVENESGPDLESLEQYDENTVDAEVTEQPAPEPKRTEAQNMKDLSFDEPKKPAPAHTQAEPEPMTGNIDEDFPPMRPDPDEQYPGEPLRFEPAKLKNHINALAIQYSASPFNEKQNGLLVNMLNRCFDNDDGDRHAIAHYLTGKQSIKDMTNGEKYALLKWLKPEKDGDGHYQPEPMSKREANAALNQAMTDAGQAPLI
jgi:phage RecT family recombinase